MNLYAEINHKSHTIKMKQKTTQKHKSYEGHKTENANNIQ